MADEEGDDRTAARRAGDRDNWDKKVLEDLMSTPQGRFWVARKLDTWGPHREVYGHDGDALGMAWRDGLAAAGRLLESEILLHCPDRYLQMIRENRARIERERVRRDREEARRAGPDNTHSGLTDIETMADEQRRKAAEEEAAAAKKKGQ